MTPKDARLLRCLPIAMFLTLCASGSAQTVLASRPVADAIRVIERLYGWPITYEDPPWLYAGDLEDVTSRVRNDGKSAGDGVPRILRPRGGTFVFRGDNLQPPPLNKRSPEAAARAAIFEMLKSYSASIGGVEIFTLTDSDGLFHVIPVQRKDSSGKLEKIVPLLDTPVSIPGKPTTLSALVNGICRSLTESAGTSVGTWMAVNSSPTYIAVNPGESARSVLSRASAEQKPPGPLSWALLYIPALGYRLELHWVDTSR
jgi:hypothetical protein